MWQFEYSVDFKLQGDLYQNFEIPVLLDNITMKVQREKMLSIGTSDRSVFLAAPPEGEGVLLELSLFPNRIKSFKLMRVCGDDILHSLTRTLS